MRKAKRYRGAVFFAQQAVEKIIKAYIVEDKNQVPRKSLNIKTLLKETDLNLKEIKELDLNELTIA